MSAAGPLILSNGTLRLCRDSIQLSKALRTELTQKGETLFPKNQHSKGLQQSSFTADIHCGYMCEKPMVKRILYSNEAQRVRRELEVKNKRLSDDLLVRQQHLDQVSPRLLSSTEVDRQTLVPPDQTSRNTG